MENETGKKLILILEGTNVEIDRKILEQLNSPLVHLIRNAIYHGIELPRVRVKKMTHYKLMQFFFINSM